ncbi:hypothetical protein GNZ12_34090 [Paraburkholderia sp. 1N]|uniref:Uncharacterized protein n=1 Tax=Paraburkholderia solitsugae TaxID=2675748 RepID=A0ABX2BZJ8_9BURK|nr:hypothetical protein [Paraburkholderia solitsugae]NPT42374.1 hypothetical protein [Paraburkholderia solitsugae]NPT46269.1 hypothetical protein [Paraburkholderia solitsugae]
MEIERFTFMGTGERVVKVSGTGINVYIAESVPVEVLEMFMKRMRSQMARRIGRLRHAERRWKRRRLKRVRVRVRRCWLKKRRHKPRERSRMPRR